MAENDTIAIACGEALGIADVADVYATLLSALAEGSSVDLDISKLERIDAAALQMLYAFSKELATQGSSLTWTMPSEAFSRSAKLLGMTELVNLENNGQELAQ
jgi:anti-anti-sigma regulatory factor